VSTSAHTAADQEFRLRLDQIQARALAVGGVGFAFALVAWAFWPALFYPSYLVGYLFWVGIALGCSGLTLLHHLVGGSWGLPIRRPLESGAAAILPLALLFLPVAMGLATLYPWARPESEAAHAALDKSPWLDERFFLLRTVFYFMIWIILAQLLNALSNRQDSTADHTPSRRLQALSGPGLVLLFLTGSFSAVDWGMSLDLRWTSTIYGAMLITGDALATLALMIVVGTLLAEARPSSAAASSEQFHDLGNLLLAFVMLWAYMSFCQLLIVWSGNLTAEIPWYLRRTRGGWEWVALGLIVFHFFLPFFVLLYRQGKRSPRFLRRVALLVLTMHWVDLIWLVLPASSDPASPRIPWAALPFCVATVVGIGGVWMAYFIGTLKRRPLVPLNDPRLVAAVRRAGDQTA
jgi:hypothetical protein